MNSESERPQDELAALGPHGFAAHPGHQEAGEIAEGQLVDRGGGHDQGVGAVAPEILRLLAGVSAGVTSKASVAAP